MDCKNNATFKAAHLLGWGRFEGLAVRVEPSLQNALATYPLVDTTSNGFYLGEFGHLFIVGECR
jgi:hypothetical protein